LGIHPFQCAPDVAAGRSPSASPATA